MTNKLSWCGEQVRRFDSDRFLTCLFAPAPRRESLFALYAFNLEIAKTREVVREPMMGRIRLQWWREAIAELYQGQVRGHEVLQALAPVLPGRVEESLFQALIDARELDLDEEPPATGTILNEYTRATGGGLMQMAAKLLDVTDPGLLEAAEDMGEGVALTGLLRAVRFHAAQHKSYLPADLMRQMGVDPRRPRPGKPFGIEVVAMLLATEAERLIAAHPGKIPRSAIAAFLPATLAKTHLGRLAALGHDPFNPKNDAPYPWKPLKLAKAWALRTI